MAKSKTIFITGAGSGIGKDAAFEFAIQGHRVIATTETQEQADALRHEGLQKGLGIECYKLDITNANDRASVKKYKDIDVLANNAAIGESGSLADIDVDIVRHSFEVNVFASLELTQLVLKHMMKRNTGTVLFISSTAGRIMMPFLAPYSMTKFALSSGVEALRSELHMVNKHIHVSVIEPGAYHTGFNQKMIESQFLRMHKNSYFYAMQDAIRKRLEIIFRLIEVKSTKSIVRVIVRAAESENPKLRYVAPKWQALGVRVLRMLGK